MAFPESFLEEIKTRVPLAATAKVAKADVIKTIFPQTVLGANEIIRTGHIGLGGMLTKVLAAKIAVQTGATTVIASGREPKVLTRLMAGEKIGTRLSAK